jgi:hypothetical protein
LRLRRRGCAALRLRRLIAQQILPAWRAGASTWLSRRARWRRLKLLMFPRARVRAATCVNDAAGKLALQAVDF